jgi:EAL domain-containing protein (putative c-di-GMP-specific phosphodiesterase class I)
VSLWVNLTAIDLLDKELPKRLEERLRAYGVKPERLGVELTESTVMADPDQAQSILESIAATGVRLSIDDFGTGYSSLAYLKRLPVQELKIDRSFVSDMAISRNDLMIVEATIQLGHSLGLQVVAEGVETDQILDVLASVDCDIAQGYLLARPMPPDQLPGWLAVHRTPVPAGPPG